MPTHDDAIGFSNIWYPKGFENAVFYDLGEENRIRIFSCPYFIASKLEAFKSRGNHDGRTSSDFEDIVFVLENNSLVWEEMDNADEDIRRYLLQKFPNKKDKVIQIEKHSFLVKDKKKVYLNYLEDKIGRICS